MEPEKKSPLAGLAVKMGMDPEAAENEIIAAIDTWDRSTAYHHCWLVLPVAAWLGWERRQRLSGLLPQPWTLAALPAMAAGMVWLVAERLGSMEGRHLAALAVMLSLVLAVLGWPFCRAMAAPLAYLVFLVPFGAFLVPSLQRVTAWMIVAGLQLLDIPHYADELTIELAAGTFLVAEACAGLRFMVASLAFGALYALVMFRAPWRRAVVMLLALVVPVLANGLRALGIVLLGHHLGSAEAAAADHLIYGWIFFSVVIALLVLAGLPFRQDGQADPPMLPRAAGTIAAGPAIPAGLVLVTGLVGPALAMLLAQASAAPVVSRAAALAEPQGCATSPQGLLCEDVPVAARVLVFAPRVTWSSVVAARQGLAGQDDEAMTFNLADTRANWHVRQSRGSGTAVAVATWLGGQPAGDGMRSRAVQGWNSLMGGAGQPVVAVVVLQAPAPRSTAEQRQQRRLMAAVLAAQADGLSAAAAVASRPR
jgi:exosortase A